MERSGIGERAAHEQLRGEVVNCNGGHGRRK